MTFRDYMTQRLNGRKWVVACQSSRLVAKGYEVFLSQKQYKAMDLEAHKAGCTGCFWGAQAA